MASKSNGTDTGAEESNKVTLMLVNPTDLPPDFESMPGDQVFDCKQVDKGDHIEVTFTVAERYVREVRKNFCGFPTFAVGTAVRVNGDNERLLSSLKNYYRHHGVTVLD